MKNNCTHCGKQQDFVVADSRTLHRRTCSGCGELLYVDYALIDWKLIAADSLKRYYQDQDDKKRRMELCTE